MLGSFKSMAHNIGESFNVGFRAGVGDFKGASRSAVHNDLSSVGGLMTMGGLGTAGAGTGAWYGSISNAGPDPAEGALAGGAIGATALPAAGLAAAAGWGVVNNLDKIGGAAFAAGRGAAKFGGGLYNSMSYTGGFNGSSALGRIGNAVAHKSHFMNPLGHYANQFTKAAKSVVKFEPGKKVWNEAAGKLETQGAKIGLTKWGYGLMMGSGLAQGAAKALDTFESSRMGTMDSYVTTATPRIPSYQDNAGASGDLVFALNANRRG